MIKQLETLLAAGIDLEEAMAFLNRRWMKELRNVQS